MMIWLNKFTAPGWMVVPCKPHPFGNEWHTICCALCGILFWMELVEGKDQPSALGDMSYSEHGSTVGLMVHMTETLWGTGAVVEMDSGFCVLKAIVR